MKSPWRDVVVVVCGLFYRVEASKGGGSCRIHDGFLSVLYSAPPPLPTFCSPFQAGGSCTDTIRYDTIR